MDCKKCIFASVNALHTNIYCTKLHQVVIKEPLCIKNQNKTILSTNTNNEEKLDIKLQEVK